MSYAIVYSIRIDLENKQVFWNYKCNNDTEPFKTVECTGLSEILREQGEDELHFEILKAYECGEFQPGKLNRYTEMRHILSEMEEYQQYNWRRNDVEYSEICKARNSQGYKELLMQVFKSNAKADKFILAWGNGYVLKNTSRKIIYTDRRERAKTYYKSEAKKLIELVGDGILEMIPVIKPEKKKQVNKECKQVELF